MSFRPPSPPGHIGCFISGHGYGHGVRSSAYINALPLSTNVTIFSSLPEVFFREEITHAFSHFTCEIDCGCVQPNTAEVDIEGTLKKYASINEKRDTLIADWAFRLNELGVDRVIGDIPPLAFPIARMAGLPSLAISNFTWVEIYEPYLKRFPRYAEMLQQMRRDYSQAHEYTRVYPSMETQIFPQQSEAGILCRPGKNKRAEFGSAFGLDPGKKWCLVYIGSYGLEGVNWANLSNFTDWEFMGLYPLPGAPSNYHRLAKDVSYSYGDLTASCDLVLGKLGYGLVGECLALGKPVLFLARSHFSEYDMLKQTLESREQGLELDLESFKKLEFQDKMELLYARSHKPMSATGIGDVLTKLGFPLDFN